MKEIKFRGQKENSKEWVEGNLIRFDWGDFIVKYGSFEERDRVIPESVGQFTGLTDKNGKEIYEGDIIKVHIERADFVTVVTWGKNSRGWKLKCDRTSIDRWGKIKYYSLPSSDRIEIIGNIWDTPELLK